MQRLNSTTIPAAAFLVLWSLLWAYTSASPLAGLGSSISYDPLYYPSLLITAGWVLSAMLLGGELCRPRAAGESIGRRSGRTAAGIALVAGYLMLLMPLGFLLSSAIFFAAFAVSLGYRRPIIVAAAAIGTTAAVWLIFTQLLKAPLPAWPRLV